MKWLIGFLTAATGLLHVLVGLGMLGGIGSNTLLLINGIGYLVLLVLYWTASPGRHNLMRWVLFAYTVITIVGYFVLNPDAMTFTIGLIIKGIEIVLALLLLFDRAPQVVAKPAAAASRAATSVGTTASSTATAVGAATVATASRMGDTVVDTGEAAAEKTVEVTEAVVDAGEAAVDTVADAGEGAVDAVVDAGEGAAGWAAAAAGAAVAGAAAMADDAEEAVEEVVAEVDETADRAVDMVLPDEAPEPTAEDLRAELEQYLKSFGSSSEFRKDVEYVEGIGPVYGAKLREAGVVTVMDLMVEGATRRGRKQLSDRSGINQSNILTWVNHVDLYRIKGVAEEYADLLEQSGVDTVVELAHRNPNNLHQKMLDINEQKKLVRRPPHLSEVESWVTQAKDLKRLVHY